MAAPISFFDMSVSITPPGGHLEPIPLTLGPNWQPNDIRMAFIAAAGSSGDITLTMPMTPDPPSTFTTAFSINPGHETNGAYFRRLVAGNNDTSFAIYKPEQWEYYMFGTLTAREVSPTVAPTAGRLTVTYTVGATTASIASVTVPAAGTMVFFIGTVPDPSGVFPAWASSMGAPTGWTNLVATAKSGNTYYPFDDNPGLLVVAKNYSSSGTTGAVAMPLSIGSPAFLGMYMFLRPAADVSATIGAA